MNQLNFITQEDDYMEISKMLTSKKPIYELLELNELLALELTKSPKRILVIEDDASFEPIWDYIISKVSPEIEFYWASNPMQAQEMIFRSKTESWSYDLIISDIYLSSPITGIDLWNTYGSNDNFLLISSIDNHKLIEQAKLKGKAPPPYIQKPLDVNECSKVIAKLLNFE